MTQKIAMLEQMIANKKPTLTQLGLYLKKIKQSQTQNLQKKSIIVIYLAKCFYLSCKLWLEELEKFKHQIFYSHFLKTKDKKVRNTTTGKKKQIRVSYQKVNDVPKLSLEEMVKRIDETNQTQSSLITPRQTPKKEPMMHETKEPITLPPFDDQISGQMAEEIATLIKSQKKQESRAQSQELQRGWKPDLQAYKNILDITPNQTNLSAKRRRMSRTKARNQTTRLVQIADKKLQITQGDQRIRQLQLLTTKVKLSKQKEAENLHYFSNILQKINPLLMKNNYLISRIVEKKSQIPKINEEHDYSPMFQFSINFLNASNQKQQRLRQDIYVNLQDNASISNQLQIIIKNKIDSQLFLKPFVSFQKFSENYQIKKQIKGQLFFQLLHSGYHLSQENPETFSDIKITN